MKRSALDRLTGGSHAGLLLSCYLESDDARAKAALMRQAISALPQAAGPYRLAYQRWLNATQADASSARVEKFVTVRRRMALGLGRESVTETGVALHHTYGVPLLPGTALKGLAAHYCDQVWGSADPSFRASRRNPAQPAGCHYRVLFGETEEAGHIVFYDAWIDPATLNHSLQLDVMTPHHTKYNIDGSVAPSDLDDPIPVPFLSVHGRFRIALECDVKSNEGHRWAQLALEILIGALKNWGLGGKTSSGYGRLI